MLKTMTVQDDESKKIYNFSFKPVPLKKLKALSLLEFQKAVKVLLSAIKELGSKKHRWVIYFKKAKNIPEFIRASGSGFDEIDFSSTDKAKILYETGKRSIYITTR